MRIKDGAKVVSAEGETVGSVDRVVIDPRSKQVTHIVVRKGLLFKTDKVVPVRYIDDTGEADTVHLRPIAGNLQALPDFEETHYVMLDERELLRTPAQEGNLGFATPYYPYPGLASRPLLGAEYLGSPGEDLTQPLIPETSQNIPDESVALEQGAKVYAQDGAHIGELESVIMNQERGRATHFILSTGRMPKRRKVIPIDWVDRYEEDRLLLSVGESMVDRLPDYQEG